MTEITVTPFAMRPAASARTLRASPLVPVAAFLVCIAWRSPGLLLAPRFWAEEGSLYYARLQGVAPLKGLVRVFNGNYQFLTNAVVELSLRVPARYAAHVTTYLSLAVALACCWTIARLMLSRGCSTAAASAACALFALQPGGYEVFLSATNVQWVSSVLAMTLLLAEDGPARSSKTALRCAVLLACGLTGTTSCILLPLFLAGALRRRSGSSWAMAGVLGAATLVQGAVVLLHRADVQRPLSLSSHMVLPEVFQAFFALFLPAHVLDAVGATTAAYDGLSQAAGVQIALLGLAAMAGVAWAASSRLGAGTAATLLAGAALIPLVDEFGAVAGADAMLSGWAGSRYFFLGASCMIVLMAGCLRGATAAGRLCGAALVALSLSNGVATAVLGRWTPQYLAGPSVAAQVDACGSAPRCIVKGWPAWGSFDVELRQPR